VIKLRREPVQPSASSNGVKSSLMFSINPISSVSASSAVFSMHGTSRSPRPPRDTPLSRNQ